MILSDFPAGAAESLLSVVGLNGTVDPSAISRTTTALAATMARTLAALPG